MWLHRGKAKWWMYAISRRWGSKDTGNQHILEELWEGLTKILGPWTKNTYMIGFSPQETSKLGLKSPRIFQWH